MSFVALVLAALLLAPLPQRRPNPPEAEEPAETAQAPKPAAPTPKPGEKQGAEKEKPEEPPVVTRHEIRIGGRLLKYTVTAGMMPLKNARSGETEAHIFFMAYTADNAGPVDRRPLMFSFNGGPGSSSVWLHLGALGPKRVQMLENGFMPAPPYHLVDNEYTWLDKTDLVFIDPVGTGYSRAAKPELAKNFFTRQGDVASVGEFIRLYLTRYQRWASPLFLVGESYGTTRASALSGYLIEHGIAFNGIVLVSTVIDFATIEFAANNDLPCILYVPSYTATAWYHKRLPPDLQQQDLIPVLHQAEQWTMNEYAPALAKGDRLTPDERQRVIGQLARYTGLDPTYIDQSNLRIEIEHFTKALLRDRRRTVGRLDSRFEGVDYIPASELPDFDPSMAAIRPPYTAMFNHYVRGELGYKSDLEYYILGGGLSGWDMQSPGRYPDVSAALRSAFAKNPYLRVLVNAGYYDLATPYFAMEYTFDHMGLDPSLRRNVSMAYYRSGHMVYIDTQSLADLKQNVARFIDEAMAQR